MRKIKFICTFLLFIIILIFPKLNVVIADEYFVSYGNITWKEEQVYLANFAIELNHSPEMTGYIGFYVGKNDNLKKIKLRIKRSKEFLVYTMKVKENRIIVINAGKAEDTKIILQPVSRNIKPPIFNDNETKIKYLD